ncbi:MAG: 1-acyl-sn-glycerol-3-phosphate acyltransferase [Candidatus Acetothermia bacterium]|jgi:1-acyl-sn-glycerol-3-phosphate acyltransferase|nr:1-acyl-sn-glycerol-3-phosphate acyltransferase [Candidatus Acetothermia bacterium]MDH7504989.1 lysophospholipid acyltransferase family protein [Candidatus Acetothermia bacterium]
MIALLLKIVGLFVFLPMELIARSVRLEVQGREHIPEGGYILCPTHVGELDPYFVRRALGERWAFKGRNRFLFRLEFGLWVRRLFLAYWGGWILEESGPNLPALRGALAWLARERPVTIFPEGHQHGQGLIYSGAAFLACRSGKPLLPLVIDRGVFVGEGTPFYVFPFLVLRRYRRAAPRVKLTFLEPLRPDLERYRREGREYLQSLSRELGRRLFGQELEVVG